MNVGFSTGYRENFWGEDWFAGKQIGGSERSLVGLAHYLADAGFATTIRLPYRTDRREWRGVRLLGADAPSQRYDVLFCYDDYSRCDTAERIALVAHRSDPPVHKDFDALIALSGTHARICGMPEATIIGNGIDLLRYSGAPLRRVPRRVIYTSSPDRGGHHAALIGQGYDYVATYRGANELDDQQLLKLQKTAQVWIHPYEAPRESEFFCLSALEALACGTPCVVSDGPALVELWGDVALVLKKPIRYRDWHQAIDLVLEDRAIWNTMSQRGLERAKQWDWSLVAPKYLKAVNL